MAVSFRSFTVWSLDGAGKAIPNRTPKGSTPEDLVLYCARHDYGTRVLSNIGNLAAVMTTMGHKDLRAAMQYQPPDLEIVRAALNRTNGSSLQTTA
jgi:hypothetical protein